MSAEPQRMLLGVSLMSLAMFTAAGIDISVKALTGGFDTPQIVLLRSLFALPVVLLICHYQSGLRSLATPRWGWQIYRGLLTAGANFGFFYALAHVPIVTALLLSYIGPVLIVLLSRPLLGERVGLHQWLGISVAFTGERPTMVLTSGNDAFEPQLASTLGETLRLDAQVANPLDEMLISDRVRMGHAGSEHADWAAAVGLSLRDLPEPRARARKSDRTEPVMERGAA